MIVKKNKLSMVEFDELAPGDVFVEEISGEELVQMKIISVPTEDGGNWNCVALEEGRVYYTKPTAIVCRVSAELNIL